MIYKLVWPKRGRRRGGRGEEAGRGGEKIIEESGEGRGEERRVGAERGGKRNRTDHRRAMKWLIKILLYQKVKAVHGKNPERDGDSKMFLFVSAPSVSSSCSLSISAKLMFQ